MLRYSFNLNKEADIIEEAIKNVLKDGYRTADIYTDGYKKVGTIEMGNEIINKI
jgi:3-isopropylmalate dehydrogenase